MIQKIKTLKLNEKLEILKKINNPEFYDKKQISKDKEEEYELETLADLPFDAIEVREFKNSKFENYYFDIRVHAFYFFDGILYHRLRVNYDRFGNAIIFLRDINHGLVIVRLSEYFKFVGLR